MKKKDWYDNWFSSAYYKILYSDRDDREAEEFVETLLNHLQPEAGSRMLDIACGEGRHSLQLASHGFEVMGIDLSYQSIRKAQESEHEHLQFYVHDMRFPFYINYFDYTFNFFTSFGYFASDRDHVMAAKSFAAAMKKDSLLVIDYLNAPYIINNIIPEETIVKEDISFHINKTVTDKHIIKNIRFKDKQGKDNHYAERVATFMLPDFIRIFGKANLTLVETFGDYQLNEFDIDSSPRLIMVFKK